jgi:NADPH:quinone reductase-like Zn-dependent oxidoreductase
MVVRQRYGGPERVVVVEQPEPSSRDLGPDQVLVRVVASSVNALDVHELRGEPMPMRLAGGLRRPKQPRLGTDLAGVVEEVGAEVTDLRPGDEVLGVAPGAFGELVVARAGRLAKKPAGLAWDVAGMLPVAACTALLAVRDGGGVTAAGSGGVVGCGPAGSDGAGRGSAGGQGGTTGRGGSAGGSGTGDRDRQIPRLLVVGAGGGVGAFAVDIAKQLGAEVTATTRATSVAAVRALGADRVLDHGREDVLAGGDRYDTIVDLGGTRPVGAYRRILAPGGRFVVVGGPAGRWVRPLDRMVAARIASLRGPERFVAFLASVVPADLAMLADWAASGAIRPMVDRVVPLDGVPDTLEAFERGELRGKAGVAIPG